MSGEMWKRLPIVLAGSYMDKAVLGAFLAAMDMVGKIQIVNQSLWPLLGPRLAGLFASNPREFRVKAIREIFEIGGLNAAVVCLALGAWSVAGGLLVGHERWLAIGSTFYLAMAVEVTVAVPFILNMCVLVPSSALGNIAVPTIFIRASSVVLLVVLIELAVPEQFQLPLALAAPGAMVAAWYAVVTRNKLRALASEFGPPAF